MSPGHRLWLVGHFNIGRRSLGTRIIGNVLNSPYFVGNQIKLWAFQHHVHCPLLGLWRWSLTHIFHRCHHEFCDIGVNFLERHFLASYQWWEETRHLFPSPQPLFYFFTFLIYNSNGWNNEANKKTKLCIYLWEWYLAVTVWQNKSRKPSCVKWSASLFLKSEH